MSETGLLKYSAHLDSFTVISSLATTGDFVLPGIRRILYPDEQAKSAKTPNKEQFPQLCGLGISEPKEETETGAQINVPEVSRIQSSGIEMEVPWQPQARRTDWTHRLAGALLDDDNWDQLVHHAPEQALTRWMTARILSYEESISRESQATASPDRLLTLLVDSPSFLRNKIYSVLVQFCTPWDILDASLAQYEQTCQEQYLLQALSLLERVGKEAWPALRWLVGSERPECELFVGLIANCEQVTVNERLSVIKELSQNPHVEVRSRIIEQLTEFHADAQRSILEILAKDDEPEIREEAEQDLAELK